MKITKLELREMIRECLHEELNIRRQLQEANASEPELDEETKKKINKLLGLYAESIKFKPYGKDEVAIMIEMNDQIPEASMKKSYDEMTGILKKNGFTVTDGLEPKYNPNLKKTMAYINIAAPQKDSSSKLTDATKKKIEKLIGLYIEKIEYIVDAPHRKDPDEIILNIEMNDQIPADSMEKNYNKMVDVLKNNGFKVTGGLEPEYNSLSKRFNNAFISIDGSSLKEELEEGAFNGGQAEGGFRDTAKRPGGHTKGSGTNFKALDGKKTKTIKAKDLKPGMVTDTGKVLKVTNVGWMNGKETVEVSYGGIGAGGSYASDRVAADRDYEVLDESLKESVDVLDVSASEVDDLARDVFVDLEFEYAYAADGYVVGETVEALIIDVLSDEYPNTDLGSVPDRVASALENMIAAGLLG